MNYILMKLLNIFNVAVEITAMGPTKRGNRHAEVEPNVRKICLYSKIGQSRNHVAYKCTK